MEQRSSSNKNIYRLIIAGGALICFAFISFQISLNETNSFDTVVREWIYGLRNPLSEKILIFFTYLGNWQSLVGLAVILILIPKTRKNIGVPMAVTAITSTIIYSIAKDMFERQRPDVSLHLINQGGYSFPSGHSMNGLVFFGILIYLVRRNCESKKGANILTLIMIALILIIGFSRVFVGVHYPTDVLGGWSLGTVILMGAMVVIDELEFRNILQFRN